MKKKVYEEAHDRETKSISIKDLINNNNINEESPLPQRTNNKTYSELLKHPKWQRKRLEIMQRDNFRCCLCQDDETSLNIHHKRYINNKKPWEYEDELLITVCEDCHFIIEDLKKYPDGPIDILNCKVLKIKNNQEYPEIHFFISLKDDINKNGFRLVVLDAINRIASPYLSYGNRVGSFNKIIDFLNNIKDNE